MWQRLSFRTQLFLPLGLSFLAALAMGGLLLQIFAAGQLADENEPGRRSTQAVAVALNNTLSAADNPRKILDAFVNSLDTSSDIQFRSLEAGPAPSVKDGLREVHGVPQWFVDLIAMPDMDAASPVIIDGRRVGDIVFMPNLSADLFEKWIGFLALTGLIAVLMVLTERLPTSSQDLRCGPCKISAQASPEYGAAITRRRFRSPDRRRSGAAVRRPMRWPRRSRN